MAAKINIAQIHLDKHEVALLNEEGQKKGIKEILTQAAVIAAVLVLSLFVIAPSVVRCIVNVDRSKCERHIYIMLHVLADGLEDAEESSYWYGLIQEENYSELIEQMSDRANDGETYPASDYYAEADSEQITIYCRVHSDISGKSLKFTLPQDENTMESAEDIISYASDAVTESVENAVNTEAEEITDNTQTENTQSAEFAESEQN